MRFFARFLSQPLIYSVFGLGAALAVTATQVGPEKVYSGGCVHICDVRIREHITGIRRQASLSRICA
jgi:hypothetical protein